MSLGVAKHNFFLVYAPDKPNAQRAKHIAVHMERGRQLWQSGIIKAGGGLLPQDVKATDEGAAEKLCGGFIIVKAESIEEVWKIIKEDVFYTSGEVWDREKIIIEPAYIVMPEAKFD
ncbi:hypothetical protein GY45DRAFT_1319893 [Cubamyces sp. BRFM 1775]|nr:hypothetical protein GY45DRAFT_1319893 [Cubamyces sp. BRFM 1775]